MFKHQDFELFLLDCVVSVHIGCIISLLLIFGKSLFVRNTLTMSIINQMIGVGFLMMFTIVYPIMIRIYFITLAYAYGCIFTEISFVFWSWVYREIEIGWKDLFFSLV